MTVPIMPEDRAHKNMYVVLSDRCVWGKPGDEVELELTAGQELSLVQAGTVKRADPPPSQPPQKRTASKVRRDRE